MKPQVLSLECNAGPIALTKWCSQVGITPITAWRWRKRGWLETTNIAGRVYITPRANQRFNERAASGEFTAFHPVPSRRSNSNMDPSDVFTEDKLEAWAENAGFKRES